jgi:hypothetical protein
MTKKMKATTDADQSKETVEARVLFDKFAILGLLYGPDATGNTASIRIILFFVILFLVGIGFSAIDGSIYIKGDPLGYLEDPANPFYMIALGISTYLVLALIRKFKLTFLGSEHRFDRKGGLLHAVEFDNEREAKYRAFVNSRLDVLELKTSFARILFWEIWALALVIFLAGSLGEPLYSAHMRGNWNFSFYPRSQLPFWIRQYPLGFIFNQLKDAFVYLVLIPALGWFALMIAVHSVSIVRWVQKNDMLHIVPTAPDNAGGLKPLGEISLILFYIVIIQLLHILPTSIILGWPPSHQAIYPPYFCLAAFVFFAPLFVVRGAMREAKRHHEDAFMDEFYRLERSFGQFDSARKRDWASIKLLGKVMSVNRERYKFASSMAVWPYDFRTLAKFLTGISIPMMFYVLQILLQESNILKNPQTIWKLFGY